MAGEDYAGYFGKLHEAEKICKQQKDYGDFCDWIGMEGQEEVLLDWLDFYLFAFHYDQSHYSPEENFWSCQCGVEDESDCLEP